MEHGIRDRFFCGNLRWTSKGEVWASWRLQPLTRARTASIAEYVHAPHAALYRALPGLQCLLQGLLTWTDPAHIVGKMIEGVDLAQCPSWADECAAVIDELDGIPFGQRRWHLHVKLAPGLRWQIKTWARTAFNEVADTAGLHPLPPGPDELQTYRRQAELVGQRLPVVFDPQPVTESELVWARRHAQSRTGDLVDPVQAPDLAEEFLEVSGRAAVGEPLLDPNAISDLPPGRAGALQRIQAPFRRRFLKVISDTGEESYQAGMVLSKVPAGMVFPDCEFLGRIDDSAVPLDVSIPMTIRTRHAALKKNEHALRQLNDQLEQVEGAAVQHAAQMLRLTDAAEVLAEYHADMQRDDKEVEVEPIILLSTAAPAGENADHQAKTFLKSSMNDKFTWARPPGAEEAIFWGMQPGSGLPALLRDYRQITKSASFAAAAPLTANTVGADSGILAGINISSPLRKPWLIDLAGDTRRHKSPSIAIVGEQGSGKSAFQKTLCGAFVDRGGRMIATDNSNTREWVTFVESLDCTKAIVDVAAPESSLDPLRTLHPDLAGPVVQSFLIVLLNISATDAEGRCIAKVVKPGYLEKHQIDSMGALHRHLATDCEFPVAKEIAARMDVFSDVDAAGSLAAAIFDQSLPAIDLDARAIVIATSNVSQPTANELGSAHRYKTIPVEKIFGRALYALIARLAKQVCFADPSDSALFAVDEAHHQTGSEESIEVLIEFIRYGRRDNAALCTGSHDPEGDYPSETLRGLIKNRLVMHQTDPVLAKRCAAFLGYHPDDDPEQYEQAVHDILNLPLGQGVGIMRDSFGRIAEVQTLLPARPERREAVLSTPPQRVHS